MYYQLISNRMNIHPIVVHFPVALLTLYSIFELPRFKFLTQKPYWFYVKAVFVIVGSALSFVALASGSTALHALANNPPNRTLINLHKSLAGFSVFIFAVIAVLYIIAWIKRSRPDLFFRLGILGKILLYIEHLLLETPLILFLAFVGLCAIVLTGGFGGAIVYGTNFDPLMRPIFNWFYIP